MKSNAIDILIPAEDEQQPNPMKQFALFIEDVDEDTQIFIAPSQFSEDPNVRTAEFGCMVINPIRDDDGRCMPDWLHRNGFISREKIYDGIFNRNIEQLLQFCYPAEDNSKQKGRLYSRNIQNIT